jgi:LCP family protein required for cell wall assembly
MVPAPPAAAHRRTWPQRFLILFNVVLVMASIAGAASYGWVYYDSRQIPRMEIAEGVLEPEVKEPGEPRNFLLVGSDSREFTEGDDRAIESFGDTAGVDGQRADTIILLRVDPRTETAAIVSFPRDLVVEMPGTGGTTRINNAFEDGPEALIETVKHNFDVPVHHYVKVDFAGFKGLVDAIGGVKMFFPNPVRDWSRERGGFSPSGLNIAVAGCVTMDGDQALSYVRSRNFEEQIDGKWERDQTAPDIDRIDRQQRFMIRAANQAIGDDFLNPLRLANLLRATKDSVRLDEYLNTNDILELGEVFQDFTPDRLQRHVVQTEAIFDNGRYGGERYVDGPINAAVFNNFRDQLRSTDATPADVTVTVLNGSGTPGEATAAADALTAAGFTVPLKGDAPGPVEQTTVRHAPGQPVAADLVARYVANEVVYEEDAGLTGTSVILVTGPGFAGLLPEPRPPAPEPDPAEAPVETTTTTVDPTTETTLSPAEAEHLWYTAVAEGQCQ